MVSIIFLFLAISTTLYPMGDREAKIEKYKKSRREFREKMEARLANGDRGELLDRLVPQSEGNMFCCSPLERLARDPDASDLIEKYLKNGAKAHLTSPQVLENAIGTQSVNTISFLLENKADRSNGWAVLYNLLSFPCNQRIEKLKLLCKEGFIKHDSKEWPFLNLFLIKNQNHSEAEKIQVVDLLLRHDIDRYGSFSNELEFYRFAVDKEGSFGGLNAIEIAKKLGESKIAEILEKKYITAAKPD